MTQSFESLCSQLMLELRLADASDILSIEALTGGVSSDIALVRLRHQLVCVKRALPALRVAALWQAPVHRNATEYRWLTWVAGFMPQAVPKLFGQSETLGAFAMAYLDPAKYKNWKQELLAGRIDPKAAMRVARNLALIHAQSNQPSFDARVFQNKDDFFALRLEPYLAYTAARYPSLADKFGEVIDFCHGAQIALVHGDISPKNILLGPEGPVFLDAECAVMGDPAFDLAFCLNHLLLKAIHLPDLRENFLKLADDFWSAYAALVNWEDPRALEARVARVLPMLFLARVDGKSPAEYLGEEARAQVRMLALQMIANPSDQVGGVLNFFPH